MTLDIVWKLENLIMMQQRDGRQSHHTHTSVNQFVCADRMAWRHIIHLLNVPLIHFTCMNFHVIHFVRVLHAHINPHTDNAPAVRTAVCMREKNITQIINIYVWDGLGDDGSHVHSQHAKFQDKSSYPVNTTNHHVSSGQCLGHTHTRT